MPNTIWLSIAIQNSRMADADAYSTTTESAGDDHKTLRRLWWCCTMRDRIQALGLRRSLLLTRAHFNFEKHMSQGCSDLQEEISHSRVYSGKAKEDLAAVLCNVVELCVILTDVILLAFPWDSTSAEFDGKTYSQCKKSLDRWFVSSTVQRQSVGDVVQDDSVILFANLMFMHYQYVQKQDTFQSKKSRG